MDSIDDIKEEIVRLSEAIANLATQNTQDEGLRKELKSLANDLTERVHLLGFAYHVFDETSNITQEASEPVASQTPPAETLEKSVIEEEEENIVAEEDLEVEEKAEEEVEEKSNETIKNEEQVEEIEDTSSENQNDEAPKLTPESLNEKISKLSQSESLANKLQNQPIKNLKTAIGLNERFLFANELFSGDGSEYNRAIEEFNHLESLDAALRLIEHKYQPTYNWDFDNRTVQNFLLYLKRRFSYRESS